MVLLLVFTGVLGFRYHLPFGMSRDHLASGYSSAPHGVTSFSRYSPPIRTSHQSFAVQALPSSPPHIDTSHVQPSPQITGNLHAEDIYYSTGNPLFGHYTHAQPFVSILRYRVLASYRTSWVNMHPVLVQRQAHLLGVFAESFPYAANCLGTPATISDAVYQSFPGFNELVDTALLACPVIVEGHTYGYHLDAKAFIPLCTTIQELYSRWIVHIPRLEKPRWAFSDMPGQVWHGGDFEMFAVKYREEVETFLHLIHLASRSQLTGRPYKPEQIRSFPGEQASDYYSFMQTVPRPSPRAPQNASRAQATRPSLANTTFVTAPPPYRSTVHYPRAYQLNPADISTSQRLRELVGVNEQQFNEDKTPLTLAVQDETPLVHKAASHIPVRFQLPSSSAVPNSEERDKAPAKPNTRFSEFWKDISGYQPFDSEIEHAEQVPLTQDIPIPTIPHQTQPEEAVKESASVKLLGDFYFDRKLKPDVIPLWNGNPDQLESCLRHSP